MLNMELVRTQGEANALPPKQVFKRLRQFIDEMYHSTDRLPKEFVEQLSQTPKDAIKLLHANLKTLTEEEFKSVDYCLTSSLKIVKGLLKKKIKPFLDTLFDIVEAYDIFSLISYRRRYEKALMLWMVRRSQVEAICHPLPSELACEDINFQIAKEIGVKFNDDGANDIHRLLTSIIQDSNVSNDELVKKATLLLSEIRNAETIHERDWRNIKAEQEAKWKAMSGQERFLTRIAQRLPGKNYKVIVKSNHLELISDAPDYYPSLSLLRYYTKSVSEELGLNFGNIILHPQISTTPEGYIRIDFIPKEK